MQRDMACVQCETREATLGHALCIECLDTLTNPPKKKVAPPRVKAPVPGGLSMKGY